MCIDRQRRPVVAEHQHARRGLRAHAIQLLKVPSGLLQRSSAEELDGQLAAVIEDLAKDGLNPPGLNPGQSPRADGGLDSTNGCAEALLPGGEPAFERQECPAGVGVAGVLRQDGLYQAVKPAASRVPGSPAVGPPQPIHDRANPLGAGPRPHAALAADHAARIRGAGFEARTGWGRVWSADGHADRWLESRHREPWSSANETRHVS